MNQTTITIKQAEKLKLKAFTQFLDPDDNFMVNTVISELAFKNISPNKRKNRDVYSIVKDNRLTELKEKYCETTNRDWLHEEQRQRGGYIVRDYYSGKHALFIS